MHEFAPLIALPVQQPPPTGSIPFNSDDDLTLIGTLVEALSTTASHQWSAKLAPPLIDVGPGSRLGQWLALYSKAINQRAFLDWADHQHLQHPSLRVVAGTLHASVIDDEGSEAKVFHLHDGSGWRELADPILGVTQIIDPGSLGLPYIGPSARHSSVPLPLDLTLAFYGYPMPQNPIQAKVIMEELQTFHAFPAIGDDGRSHSIIRHELEAQSQDMEQLADTLEYGIVLMHGLETSFDLFLAYRMRLTLTSRSFVADTLQSASQLLLNVVSSAQFKSLFTHKHEPDDYFIYSGTDHSIRSSSLESGMTTINLREPLGGSAVAAPLIQLARLATSLDESVSSNNSISLAQLMRLYAIEVPISESGMLSLIEDLRQTRPHAQPYCSDAALNLRWLENKRNSLSFLNNINSLKTELERISVGRPETEKVELREAATLDADSTFYQMMERGVALLRQMTNLIWFHSICLKHRVEVETAYVRVDELGQFGAYDRLNHWQDLTLDIGRTPQLRRYQSALTELAQTLGGEVRSDSKTTLKQFMQFLRMPVVELAGQAAQAAQYLRAVRVTTPRLGNYWNGLGLPVPAHLNLSAHQRQQVADIQQQFAQAQGAPLFDYLGKAYWAGKADAMIRAEADLLLSQMLRSSRAQAMADQLAAAIIWTDDAMKASNNRTRRQVLVLTALILSLDPRAAEERNRIAGLDMGHRYHWGEPCALVRANLEATLNLTVEGSTLAAHLLLAGPAPELLVRDIPDFLPYMCSQNWVVFKQYVDFIERQTPGASRSMSYSNIMTLVHNPKKTLSPAFWSLPPTVMPIIDWARANGIVDAPEQDMPYKENVAILSFKDQKRALSDAVAALTAPYADPKDVARSYLREMYPDYAYTDRATFGPSVTLFPKTPPPETQTRTFSLLELYLAGELKNPERWRSVHRKLSIRQFKPELQSLKPSDADAQFRTHLEASRQAYICYIIYLLACLPLAQRVSLERGEAGLYSVGPAPSAASVADNPASFGVLLWNVYQSDRYVFQLFPRHLLIQRLEQPPARLFTAILATEPLRLNLDWDAYSLGSEPQPGKQAQVSLHALAIPTVAQTPGDPGPIPNTWTSARIKEIATAIVDLHLLPEAHALDVTTQALNNVSKAMTINRERVTQMKRLRVCID